MYKTTFGELARGDYFMGDPHGGWIFVKTDSPPLAVRLADGGTVQWQDDAQVFKTDKNTCNCPECEKYRKLGMKVNW
jgi:hypothetical protein